MNNKVLYIVKDKDSKKTIGVIALYNNKNVEITRDRLASSRIKFDNAIVDSNGYVRGKGESIPIKYYENNKLVLYHGSPNSTLVPTYGRGEDKHDYGRGLYLTPNIELAREWSVCASGHNGHVFKLIIDIQGLNIFDFGKENVLSWIAELMSHRDAWDSVRYKRLAPVFINKYKVDLTNADIVKGWRADSSYFNIAKEFVRDNVDVSILEKALKLGDLGVQYCIKSKAAFDKIQKCKYVEEVDYREYFEKYNNRDKKARQAFKNLIASDENTLETVFSNLIQ